KLIEGKKSFKSALNTYRLFRCAAAFVIIEKFFLNPCAKTQCLRARFFSSSAWISESRSASFVWIIFSRDLAAVMVRHPPLFLVMINVSYLCVGDVQLMT